MRSGLPWPFAHVALAYSTQPGRLVKEKQRAAVAAQAFWFADVFAVLWCRSVLSFSMLGALMLSKWMPPPRAIFDKVLLPLQCSAPKVSSMTHTEKAPLGATSRWQAV